MSNISCNGEVAILFWLKESGQKKRDKTKVITHKQNKN